MTQSISGNSSPETRNRFLEGCDHGTTFLLVDTRRGNTVIGIYAGHTEEAITLHMAGDDTGEKDQHVIRFAEINHIEVT